MAGSFDIFRKYQRSLLAAVAILAMLAFFVLPPFLQMAPDSAGVDPLVATWRDGGIREGELQRAVAMRSVLNQFLRDSIAASGRDPGNSQPLAETEEEVVRTLLLAREAEANGIVIGNGAVNQFLAQWTNNMVRPEQLEALIGGLRLGQMSVSTAEVFEALRTVLAAERMRQFSFAGFAGDPPGARWDIFRRLDQEATVEVVPVVVESLAGEVPPAPEATLVGFFERFKTALPVDRSPEPGFKEPHRISYDWIAGNLDELEAAAAKDVTDAEIEKFYEENKVRLYRTKQVAADAAAEAKAKEPDAKEPDAKEPDAKEPDAKEPDAKEPDAKEPDAKEPDAKEPDAKEPDAKEPDAKEPESPQPDPKAAAPSRTPFRTVKFRQPKQDSAAAGEAKATAAAEETKPAVEPATGGSGDAAAKAGGPPAEATPAAAVEGVEPLEKVKDDVRKRLAAEAVNLRLDGLFRAITADVAGFSRDLSRWKVESGNEANKPVPPDVEAIAAKQGLKAGRAGRRTAGESLREGGVGTSFQLAIDPSSPMGFRQAQWADLFFGMERPLWRPVETRDVPGNRYLSWKSEDVPEFVPEFAAVRADVERAWRIVEARPGARKLAEELAAAAVGGRTLADVVKDRSGAKLEAATVGPFTWLSRGSASFGSPVTLSQPAGLEMPGEEFMRAVFALEPGGTAVAFNAPQTVCYAIRLVSFAPSDEELRRRFVDPTADRRRLAAVAERDQSRAFEAWLTDVEQRAGLEWKRPPQRR